MIVLQVISMASREVVKEIDVSGKTENMIAKCEMGLLRNMDLENFFVERVNLPDAN
jgi:hypothetical protein